MTVGAQKVSVFVPRVFAAIRFKPRLKAMFTSLDTSWAHTYRTRHRASRGTSKGRVNHTIEPGPPASHQVPCNPDHCFGMTSIQRPPDSYSTARESNRKLLAPVLVIPNRAYSPFGKPIRKSSEVVGGNTGTSDQPRNVTESGCEWGIPLLMQNRTMTRPATARAITRERTALAFIANGANSAPRSTRDHDYSHAFH